MKIKISFGQTTSRRRNEAIRAARKLPGFTRREGEICEEICVSTDVPFSNPDQWVRIEDLLRIAGSWKSTTFSIDGKKVKPHWQASWEISKIISCYAAKPSAGHDLDYCLGRDTPSSDMTALGCRLLKGIDLREFGTNGARWYEFGQVSEDRKRFTVDRNAIENHLRGANKAEFCVSCPAFSWPRVRQALKLLPAEIDLAKSESFSPKFSTLDPTRPLGIQSKPRELRFFPGSRLGEQTKRDLPQEASVRNVPKVLYTDVAGQDEALQQLRDVCELPLKHPDYFSALGLKSHRGVILFGPPGNGKTLLAKAVATETNAHLEIINGPEVLSKWVGQSEANLRRVFDRARTLAPTIIVIDELDAIAPVRADMVHQHSITLISQLFVCLDGMNDRGAVFVIGTTNRLEAIDSAVKRPGRFDYQIQVPLPSAVGRRAILQAHVSKLTHTPQLEFADIAASTPNWSGAELQALVTEAGLLAIKRGIRTGSEPRATILTQTELNAAVAAFSAKREA